MGMFDYVQYRDRVYQCKDTPAQFMESYLVTDAGDLFHEELDYEWVSDSDMLLGGYLDSHSKGWVQDIEFCGEMRLVPDNHDGPELFLLLWDGKVIRQKEVY